LVWPALTGTDFLAQAEWSLPHSTPITAACILGGMKRLVGAILAILFGVGVTLAVVLFLERATLRLSQMPRSLEKAGLTLALVVFGALALLGAIYLATQVAVRLSGKTAPAPGNDVQSGTREQP
jgi:ABC-type branched-subunit amino acid transport system permease subunit